jgi:hypothetical protein
MVSSFGFLSILAFAGIVAGAGSIVAVIFDDMVTRCRLRILSRPLVALFFWGAITSAWTLFLGFRTYVWWKIRLPPSEEVPTMWWDSVWFAYISTTTVGLGDFFLQPEIIFLDDVLRFSMLFLTGFVFISTFLGKFAEVLGFMFSDPGETLKTRVTKTSPTSMQMAGSEKDESEGMGETSKALGVLKELVREEQSDDHQVRSLAMVVEEEELLKELLERKSAERLQMENEGR